MNLQQILLCKVTAIDAAKDSTDDINNVSHTLGYGPVELSITGIRSNIWNVYTSKQQFDSSVGHKAQQKRRIKSILKQSYLYPRNDLP